MRLKPLGPPSLGAHQDLRASSADQVSAIDLYALLILQGNRYSIVSASTHRWELLVNALGEMYV